MRTDPQFVVSMAVALVVAWLGLAPPAHASPGVVNWTAAGVGRPAGRLDWWLHWGDIYRDGAVLLNGLDRDEYRRSFQDITLVLDELSALAYEPQGGDPTRLGFRKVGWSEGNPVLVFATKVDPQVVVVESDATPLSPRMAAVAVRGTQEVQDFLVDVRGIPWREDGAVYHEGFLHYAEAIYGDVRMLLEGHCDDPDSAVWLTGHSLGGVTAQILAHWLQQDGCRVQGVVTFGAPRPGWDNLHDDYRSHDAARLDHNTHRWVSEYDPIRCLPSGDNWSTFGVHHPVMNDPDGDWPLMPHVTGTSSYAPPPPRECADGFLPFIFDDLYNVIENDFGAHSNEDQYLPTMRRAFGPLQQVGR